MRDYGYSESFPSYQKYGNASAIPSREDILGAIWNYIQKGGMQQAIPTQTEQLIANLSTRLDDTLEQLKQPMRKSSRMALTQQAIGLISAISGLHGNIINNYTNQSNRMLDPMLRLYSTVEGQQGRDAYAQHLQALTEQINKSFSQRPAFKNAITDLINSLSNWSAPISQSQTQPQVQPQIQPQIQPQTQPQTQPRVALPPKQPLTWENYWGIPKEKAMSMMENLLNTY